MSACTCGQRSASALHEAWHPCPVHPMRAPLDLAAVRVRHEATTERHRIGHIKDEQQAHADRGALLAALDAMTREHAALAEAHARQEWTIRTYHAERECLDAVTVEEVARTAGVDPEQAAAVLALIRARVASPEPPPHEEPPCEHRKARTTPCAACLLSARVASPERPPQPDQDHP